MTDRIRTRNQDESWLPPDPDEYEAHQGRGLDREFDTGDVVGIDDAPSPEQLALRTDRRPEQSRPATPATRGGHVPIQRDICPICGLVGGHGTSAAHGGAYAEEGAR